MALSIVALNPTASEPDSEAEQSQRGSNPCLHLGRVADSGIAIHRPGHSDL